MLTNSVLMVLFESLDHGCDPRYLKQTILTFFGIPRLVKMVNLQYLAIRAKVVIFLENYIQRLRIEMFFALLCGQYN